MADTQSVVSDVKLFLERLKKEMPEICDSARGPFRGIYGSLLRKLTYVIQVIGTLPKTPRIFIFPRLRINFNCDFATPSGFD